MRCNLRLPPLLVGNSNRDSPPLRGKRHRWGRHVARRRGHGSRPSTQLGAQRSTDVGPTRLADEGEHRALDRLGRRGPSGYDLGEGGVAGSNPVVPT
jgi:hypothetical protein